MPIVTNGKDVDLLAKLNLKTTSALSDEDGSYFLLGMMHYFYQIEEKHTEAQTLEQALGNNKLNEWFADDSSREKMMEKVSGNEAGFDMLEGMKQLQCLRAGQ